MNPEYKGESLPLKDAKAIKSAASRKKRPEGTSFPETVKYISVHIHPESVSASGSCLLCGSPMAPVSLEYEFRDETILVKNDEPVPGHRCQSCEAEYYDASVTLALYKHTLLKLPKNSKLRTPLRKNIASLTKSLTKQRTR